jgi:N-acetyl-alpha-D-muramate 1-phosphate uridylyltransferase
MVAMMPQPAAGEEAGLCGVALAAGAGARLRPLTRLRPKPLCPVANVPLLDLAVERILSVTPAVAVNVHHDREALEAHLAGSPAHVSVEEAEALGTAGALAHLRGWVDGRAVAVVNADTWSPGSLAPLVEGWDGERVRLALAGGGLLEPTSRVAAALMPWAEVAPLEAVPSGLYEVSWRRLAAEGKLDVVAWDGPCLDCGTPARYLHANLVATGGAPAVEPEAEVQGTVERSVVWSDGVVAPGEHLVDAIRADKVTVLVR